MEYESMNWLMVHWTKIVTCNNDNHRKHDHLNCVGGYMAIPFWSACANASPVLILLYFLNFNTLKSLKWWGKTCWKYNCEWTSLIQQIISQIISKNVN